MMSFSRRFVSQSMVFSRFNSSLTVYGHYVSQPSRAVIWLLKMNNIEFQFKKVEPISGETRREPYNKMFPTRLIPGLDDNGFYLAEGSAIMQYICEKYGLEQWWPSCSSDPAAIQKRAKIAEYMSHFHHSSRLISHKVIRPRFDELFANKPRVEGEEIQRQDFAIKNLKIFATTFLADGKFVNGMDQPTIADLAAYCEIGQLTTMHVFPNLEMVPEVEAWAKKMQQLPFHDDVHQAVVKMGNISLRKSQAAAAK
jgi:glutathione S-transferase